MQENLLIHGWGFAPKAMNTVLSIQNITIIDLYNNCETKSFEGSVKNIAGKITKPINVVAWSLGGLYAIKLAKLYPEKINKILLLASTPCFMQSEDWQGITKEQLKDLKGLLQENKAKALKQFAGWCATGEENIKQALSFAKTILANEIHANELLSLLNILEEQDLREEFKHIKMPTKLLLASKDSLIKQTNFENDFSNLNIEVLQGSHLLPFFLSQEKQQELIMWLQGS